MPRRKPYDPNSGFLPEPAIDGAASPATPTAQPSAAGWAFTVTQDGMAVAEGECPDRDDAIRECAHYCMMYGQDGPVSGEVYPAPQAPEVK
jgi:hypothetical protein